MSDPKTLQKDVIEQAKDLSQEQLSNLAERLFEGGKRADQHLTAWMTLAALTPLVLFGASDDPTIGGVKLDPLSAGAVTYILSCAFYYRAILSIKALEYIRSYLKLQRRERYPVLYQLGQNGSVGEEQVEREFNAYISEYPGYIASGVLVKNEALKNGTLSAKYVSFVHNLIILSFGISPYALAACLLYASRLSWLYIGIAVFGLIVTLSGNVVLGQNDIT
jgi:hypothetical protein